MNGCPNCGCDWLELDEEEQQIKCMRCDLVRTDLHDKITDLAAFFEFVDDLD